MGEIFQDNNQKGLMSGLLGFWILEVFKMATAFSKTQWMDFSVSKILEYCKTKTASLNLNFFIFSKLILILFSVLLLLRNITVEALPPVNLAINFRLYAVNDWNDYSDDDGVHVAHNKNLKCLRD